MLKIVDCATNQDVRMAYLFQRPLPELPMDTTVYHRPAYRKVRGDPKSLVYCLVMRPTLGPTFGRALAAGDRVRVSLRESAEIARETRAAMCLDTAEREFVIQPDRGH